MPSILFATVHPQFPAVSSSPQWSVPRFRSPLSLPLTLKSFPPVLKPRKKCSRGSIPIKIMNSVFVFQNIEGKQRDVSAFAGRSKKKPEGTSSGRIEGNAEVRREAKKNARIRSRRLAENLFYRHKNPNKNYADGFTEDELQMIGLGYDRMVRFMEKDDPNIRHPHDWYKYGQYGPYSWRGIVVGHPIRGRLSDECVTLIGTVRDHEEWEEIEKFDMADDFTRRINTMDKNIGFRYFWVFVRHPKWRVTELPWEQWTLVCEVCLEADARKRLDKWSLMGRLGNNARALITQCAAWMRPDIIYVKRPVYQCRFEPQDDFFGVLGPLLDPETEDQYQFELMNDNGKTEICTYFNGLCKICRVSPKSFVDDVVKAYEKLSDEKKSKCLEFLLTNHPVPLLHPYTKEWKLKLEEMEMGCDSPDDEEEIVNADPMKTEFTDWIEAETEYTDHDDDDDEDKDEDVDEKEKVVYDLDENNNELGVTEEDDKEESEQYWREEFKKALSSTKDMENLVKKSVTTKTEFYKKQLQWMERKNEEKENNSEVTEEKSESEEIQEKPEWEDLGNGVRRRIKTGKIPPELFLRAAVRPFTYKNLVKEIVLMRHAIIEGEISGKSSL